MRNEICNMFVTVTYYELHGLLIPQSLGTAPSPSSFGNGTPSWRVQHLGLPHDLGFKCALKIIETQSDN